MELAGNKILVTASKKDVTIDLLKQYNIPYVVIGEYGQKYFKKLIMLPYLSLSMLFIVHKFKPDVIFALGSIRAGHVAFITGIPYIALDDDEYSYPYYHYFAKRIFGFRGFKLTGRKITKLNTYKEFASLSPKYFTPDPSVMNRLGLGENYILMRFTGWTAFHDVGMSGISDENKLHFISQMSNFTNVYISSEKPLTPELEKYRLHISPEELHSVLYYSKLFISDSQTMTTEAAILGVPTIRSNSFVGDKDMLNFIQLEREYGLIFNIRDQREALNKALELIQDNDLAEKWAAKRQILLNDMVDPIEYLINYVNER